MRAASTDRVSSITRRSELRRRWPVECRIPAERKPDRGFLPGAKGPATALCTKESMTNRLYGRGCISIRAQPRVSQQAANRVYSPTRSPVSLKSTTPSGQTAVISRRALPPRQRRSPPHLTISIAGKIFTNEVGQNPAGVSYVHSKASPGSRPILHSSALSFFPTRTTSILKWQSSRYHFFKTVSYDLRFSYTGRRSGSGASVSPVPILSASFATSPPSKPFPV